MKTLKELKKVTPKTADEARQLAIDWQNAASEESMSWQEVNNWESFFEALGRKFHLTEEFEENGII